MMRNKALEKGNPFGALIGVSSLLAALLYVAGFTFRWSYFYNFGVQHLVFKMNFQSFLITAIELVRVPRNILLSIAFIVVPLILLNSLIRLVRRVQESGTNRFSRTLAAAARLFGLESPLVVDALRALVIIYGTFLWSSHLGYTTFQKDIVNTPDNALPAITIVLDRQKGDPELGVACWPEGTTNLEIIGNARKIRDLQDTSFTCNSDSVTWRLLYRDDASIYVFASQPAHIIKGRRPLTLVIPASAKTHLLIN
jgi:hypothetical protein